MRHALSLLLAMPSGEIKITHWIESSEVFFEVGLSPPRIAGVEGIVAERVRVVADAPPELVLRTVRALVVLNLACSSPRTRAVAEPCGAPASGGEWTVVLQGGRVDDRVLAQVTLE